MLIISLATSVAVFAQGSGRMISGTVTDAQGSPLPGVNVVIQGTLKGTISNEMVRTRLRLLHRMSWNSAL